MKTRQKHVVLAVCSGLAMSVAALLVYLAYGRAVIDRAALQITVVSAIAIVNVVYFTRVFRRRTIIFWLFFAAIWGYTVPFALFFYASRSWHYGAVIGVVALSIVNLTHILGGTRQQSRPDVPVV